MRRTLIVMLAFVHLPSPLSWILNLSTSFFTHSICLLVFSTLALSFLFLFPFFEFFYWFKYPVLINSFTCLHSISSGIGIAIQLSCTRLTRQSDADSCALCLGDGVVTFPWGSKLMVATQVRIIQYLWKMLGWSGEGIHIPPHPPPVWLGFVNPVGDTTCGSLRGFFFWVARFLPSFLENNILNFQSDLGRYKQGDSVWICYLQIYLFLNNRRFGSQTLDRDSLALRPSEWVKLPTFGFKQESSNWV